MAEEIETWGVGPWVVYFETEEPKKIHRIRCGSKRAAVRRARSEQIYRGGFVSVLRRGIEVFAVGPEGASRGD